MMHCMQMIKPHMRNCILNAVNKFLKSQNIHPMFGVELGRSPLRYNIMCAITKFLIRLNLSTPDLTYMYYALQSQKEKNI